MDSSSDRATAGGYAYIDSRFPRRRHFRDLDAMLQEIWGLSGNAGNAWYMSQITIGSLDDYQLIFEASVGNTGMGDIAIDDITFTHGACPGKISYQ